MLSKYLKTQSIRSRSEAASHPDYEHLKFLKVEYKCLKYKLSKLIFIVYIHRVEGNRACSLEVGQSSCESLLAKFRYQTKT